MKQLLNNYLESFLEIWPKLVLAGALWFLFIVLGKLFKRFISPRIRKRFGYSIASDFIMQVCAWILYIIGFLVALSTLGYGGIISGIMAGAGVSALVVGFAFKDIAENFLAGILLALNRPFEIGHVIEVESSRGRVKKLNLRNTHLRNGEGMDIFIPNATLIKSTLINYTLDGLIRFDFVVGIAPEMDIHTTRKLVLKYMEENPDILKSPKPNILVKELGVSTVDLQVMFWSDILKGQGAVDSDLRGSIKSKVMADVKDLLDANGIEMPATVVEHKMYRDSSFKLQS